LDKKRVVFDIKLNSIQDTDNPTKKEVEFILHDFDLNHNNSFISKETALNSLHTLEDMPLVCKYNPVSEAGANDDALGSHEVILEEERETGQPIIGFETVPIGVVTEPAYITTVLDDKGEEKEVVAGKGILWASRYPNAVGLLKEWNDRGISVVSSMEILYDSYTFKDGKEEILSYVYEGHCILNSEDRGIYDKVLPAYDVSKLTRLVAQAINQDEQSEEGENMEEKIENVLEDEKLEATEEQPVEKNAADENNEEKAPEEVEEQEVVEEDKQEENEIEKLQNQIAELTSTIEKLTTDKNGIEKSFNEASDKLVQLNSEVEALKPFKEQYEKAKYEKSLSEKKDFYSAKFEALKSIEKFETDEIQELIAKSVFETEEGKSATLQLNSVLVDLVQVSPKEVKKEETTIREMSSKREDLVPAKDDFDSKYFL
jgi:hypothetical protein